MYFSTSQGLVGSSEDVWNLEIIIFSFSPPTRPVGTPFEDGKFSMFLLIRSIKSRLSGATCSGSDRASLDLPAAVLLL